MISLRLDRLGPRERLGLGVLLVVLVVLLLDRLVCQPVVRRLREIDAEIETTEKRLAYNLSARNTRGEVEAAYRRAVGWVGRASPAPAEEIDRIKGVIDECARRAGVLLVSMEHRDPRETEFYREYAVDIGRFECGTPALLRFLHELAAVPGMLRVTRLNLSPGGDEAPVRGAMSVSRVALTTSDPVSSPGPAGADAVE